MLTADVLHKPISARARLIASLVAGVAAACIPIPNLGWAVRIVSGWDAAACVLVALSWTIIARSNAEMTRSRAAAEDPGRNVLWGLALTASALSLGAATILLRRARRVAPHAAVLLIALCLVAVVSAWVVTHSAYTLRYAHLYYRDKGGEGGLQFPGDGAPDDMDFAYFAFTIGMCFQVSDVTISSPDIRRAVLGHAALSFAYNTLILAFTLNLMFGLFG